MQVVMGSLYLSIFLNLLCFTSDSKGLYTIMGLPSRYLESLLWSLLNNQGLFLRSIRYENLEMNSKLLG